jgi:GGDEF domain-containing protein
VRAGHHAPFDVLNFSVMATTSAAHELPRARPVADLPLDVLIERADELARRWALALIGTRPLASLGEIPFVALAHDAPALLTQALRAMQSDTELDRLIGAGDGERGHGNAVARGLAATAGAHDSGAAIEAVEAMRGVLWEAMLDELRRPAARHVGDIADRLGYVCARTLAVTISGTDKWTPSDSVAPSAPVTVTERARPAISEDRPPAAVPARRRRAHAVIVDERAGEGGSVSPRRSDGRADEDGTHRPSAGRPLSWDESPPIPPAGPAPEIEIRDERGEEGPAAWIRSIGRQLARFAEDERPFAVLLVELRQIDEIRRAQPPSEVTRLSGQTEDALAREVQARTAGSLTRESAGRYWLLAPDTGRSGAEVLAARVRQAVAAAVSYGDAPLGVVIGAAVCPEDGRDAPALAAHADVELYSARSAAARAGNGRRGSLLASLRSAREGGDG